MATPFNSRMATPQAPASPLVGAFCCDRLRKSCCRREHGEARQPSGIILTVIESFRGPDHLPEAAMLTSEDYKERSNCFARLAIESAAPTLAAALMVAGIRLCIASGDG
jgi:hypothetical protein